MKSMQVSKDCQESYAFEFSNSPGLLTYKYPDEKQPDTKVRILNGEEINLTQDFQSDTLTVAFITVKKRCTIVRIDSSQSNDFLEFKLVISSKKASSFYFILFFIGKWFHNS